MSLAYVCLFVLLVHSQRSSSSPTTTRWVRPHELKVSLSDSVNLSKPTAKYQGGAGVSTTENGASSLKSPEDGAGSSRATNVRKKSSTLAGKNSIEGEQSSTERTQAQITTLTSRRKRSVSHGTTQSVLPSSTRSHACVGCNNVTCKPPNCTCSSKTPPAAIAVGDMPQFVMLSFDDAVNIGNMPFYRELLGNPMRKNNANGCAIAATYFVSAEYLDYSLVNELYSAGCEIALHSITHQVNDTYWKTINTTAWEREVIDERTMLEKYAHVPAMNITGFRGPFLYNGGDAGFRMLYQNLKYDSTLVHQRNRGSDPFYPYTLDYGYQEACVVAPCPADSYPGLWVVPMNTFFKNTTINGETREMPCGMADACVPLPGTANETFEFLRTNFEDFHEENRAPFPVFLHEAWLKHPERKKGYLQFVDWLLKKPEVFIVTISEVLEFMKNPRPLSSYSQYRCTTTRKTGNTCPKPKTCVFKNKDPWSSRYVRLCSKCPNSYPWLNNPNGI